MIRWKEFMEAYVPTTIIWLVLLSFLAMPEYSFPSAFLQTFALFFYSYGGHVFAHYLSKGSLSAWNPHVYLHHKKSVDMPRWLELTIEGLVDFFCFFLIILLQWATGIYLFSTRLVIGSGILYVLIHIMDYSLRGNAQHALHHGLTFCNYEPEVWDTLFDTRCQPTDPYTPMTPKIIHAVAAFTLTYALTWYLDWEK
jgi:hypothetical protein